MAFFYKNEHISCTNYAEGFNKIFLLKEIPEGHVVKRQYLDTTFLVFMLEGDVEIRYEIDKYFYLQSGYMFCSLRISRLMLMPVKLRLCCCAPLPAT